MLVFGINFFLTLEYYKNLKVKILVEIYFFNSNSFTIITKNDFFILDETLNMKQLNYQNHLDYDERYSSSNFNNVIKL